MTLFCLRLLATGKLVEFASMPHVVYAWETREAAQAYADAQSRTKDKPVFEVVAFAEGGEGKGKANG